ncbi:helix-turn-helix transcriptional regulator [Streptomyces sp. NBC_01304]|uniref:helix-turn-helix transcriptional regulator n=1 Tax=Streptomyces sp. NBC_01304 TaxID=2903818 RepID=UPI002E16380E
MTSHARVLLALARAPNARLRSVAAACEITERTVQIVIGDLEQAGYLERHRVGRRNEYILHLDQPLRHPAEAGLSVRALVELAVVGGGCSDSVLRGSPSDDGRPPARSASTR